MAYPTRRPGSGSWTRGAGSRLHVRPFYGGVMCRVQSGVAAPAGRPADGRLRRRHAEVGGGGNVTGKDVAGIEIELRPIFFPRRVEPFSRFQG